MQIVIIVILTNKEFERLKNRESHVFERMYHAYKSNIYNLLIIKMNGNESMAEELVSETFQSALKSVANLKNKETILGWLLQIANRRYYDYLRKLYREKKTVDAIKEHQNIQGNKELIDDFVLKEKKMLMYMALDNLKPIYSQLLKMKYMENMAIKEICSNVGKSEVVVTGLLFRARKSLKKEMKKLAKNFYVGELKNEMGK